MRLIEIKQALDSCDKQEADLRDYRRNLRVIMEAQHKALSGLLARFEAGEYVVISGGRHFWAKDGELLRAVYNEEITGIEELRDSGFLAKETKQ